MTWPKEYGGSEGEGVYEYLLNEQLAGRGGPQIGKGVGIVGKTIIRHGNERLKAEFLPKILRNEVEFAVGYSEPNAGSDAASMQLKATRDDGRLGPERPEDLDHLGPLRRVVLGRRAHRPRVQARRHHPVPRPDRPARHHGQRHLDDGRRAHQRGVPQRRLRARTTTWWARWAAGSSTSRRRSTSSASPCSPSRPSQQRFELLVEYVRTTVRDGVPLKDDPVVRQRLAQLATQLEVARVMGLQVRLRVVQGRRGADGRGVRVQALRHRALEAAGQRLHGHRRSGFAAAGEDRRGARWRAGPSRPTATP